jgi:hypothetical protein
MKLLNSRHFKVAGIGGATQLGAMNELSGHRKATSRKSTRLIAE